MLLQSSMSSREPRLRPSLQDSPLARYGVAVLSSGLAILIRELLTPVWGTNFPFLTLFPAALVSSWYGGLGPGLITAALSALAAVYFWIPPTYSFAIAHLADAVGLLLAVGLMLLIVLLTDAVARTNAALQHEIAERHRMDATLRDKDLHLQHSEERLRLAFAAARMGYWDCNLLTGSLVRSETAEALFGVAPGTLANTTDAFLPYVHPDDRLRALDGMARTIAEGEAAEEYRVVWPDGSVHWLATRAQTFYDAAGRAVRMIGVNLDITARKQIEEALRQSEARFRVALQRLRSHIENSPLAVIEWDNELQVCQWSPRAERIFGWQAAEVLGKRRQDWRFVAEDDDARVQQAIDPFLTSTQTDAVVPWEVHENHNYTKDGRALQCEWYNSFLYDESGRLTSILSLVQDITARKQAEETLRLSEERFAKAFQAIPDAAVIYRDDGTLLDVNQQWERLFGYRREEALGQTSLDLHLYVNPADRPSLLALSEQQGSLRDSEVAVRRRSGEVRQISISTERISVQGEPCALAILRDITEQKAAAAALAQKTAALERSNAELQQFAYVASHDLQEPLRMVATFVDLLARRYQGNLDTEAEQFIAYAVEGAKRMKSLIDDLLAYSRIGTQEELYDLVDCEEVLQHTLQTLRLAIEERQAVITHVPLPVVRAGEMQVALLLQNLLSNALKFCNAAPPRIHVSAQPRGAEWLFSVQDNGIGIDPQYAERIFVIFQRLHTRKEYPGTGLGLAICKKIIEQQGGRIWVESELGKGATFFFTLPGNEAVGSMDSLNGGGKGEKDLRGGRGGYGSHN
jgi:PAS domain S-box-containing protein